MKSITSLLACVCAVCLLTQQSSALTLTGGNVDTRATATSGKLGSSSGVITDDPAASPVVSGLVNNSSAFASAGPIAPGGLVTLPGTTGVASGTASSTVDMSQTNLIGLDLSAFNSLTNLDGGVYQGSASASFRIEFTVPQETDYNLTGSFQIDPQDILWKVQLSSGPDGFLINNATESADTGIIDASGTLRPGFTYILQGNVSISDTFGGVGTGPSSASFINASFAVPEPASLTLLACGLAAVLRRRR